MKFSTDNEEAANKPIRLIMIRASDLVMVDGRVQHDGEFKTIPAEKEVSH